MNSAECKDSLILNAALQSTTSLAYSRTQSLRLGPVEALSFQKKLALRVKERLQ